MEFKLNQRSNPSLLEPGDLRLRLSFGFILEGSLEDFFRARQLLKALPNSRLIYQTCSRRKLLLVKAGRSLQENGCGGEA